MMPPRTGSNAVLPVRRDLPKCGLDKDGRNAERTTGSYAGYTGSDADDLACVVPNDLSGLANLAKREPRWVIFRFAVPLVISFEIHHAGSSSVDPKRIAINLTLDPARDLCTVSGIAAVEGPLDSCDEAPEAGITVDCPHVVEGHLVADLDEAFGASAAAGARQKPGLGLAARRPPGLRPWALRAAARARQKPGLGLAARRPPGLRPWALRAAARARQKPGSGLAWPIARRVAASRATWPQLGWHQHTGPPLRRTGHRLHAGPSTTASRRRDPDGRGSR
jgi:hypothetical protein